MRNILVLGLYFVLSLKEVIGERENEVKRGNFPYMAVVYYTDKLIVTPSGSRFACSAVLIRSDWLISSSLETNDTQLAFPQKTLVARAGAVVIDFNFTLNEDEGEQEREVNQIVRPINFTRSQWWNNDVTLLRTLLPFIISPTVATTTLSAKDNYLEKTCSIVVFAKKYSNSTDDKSLMQLSVELLPSSEENCGVHFRNETMICATNSDENKNIAYEPEFCHSNAGGPLICEGDVIGLQTYIGNNCKPPFLYQLLSAWDDFITCGVDDKCLTRPCVDICASLGKDDPVVTFRTKDIITMPPSETAKNIMMYQPSEDSNDEEIMLPDRESTKETTVSEMETPTPTKSSTTETTSTMKDTTPSAMTETEEKPTSTTEDSETSWPKQKLMGYRKNLDEAENSENINRSANIEAQRHEVKTKERSAAESYVIGTMNVIHSLFVLFLICNI